MFLSVADLKNLLETIPSGFKSPDDEFFVAANEVIVPKFKKQGVITTKDEEENKYRNSYNETTTTCNVPGCFLTFDCVTSYQTHYNSVHRYKCATCKRSLPTPFLLDLHISESHDSYFQTRVERGEPMYACFLEECKELLLTSVARKEHCIKLHKFPANFRFDQIANKKNKNKSLKTDVEMSECDASPTATTSKIKAFSFGHGKARSFNKMCSKRNTGIENLDDLMDALDD